MLVQSIIVFYVDYADLAEMHHSSGLFIFRFNLVLEDSMNFAQIHMKKRGANRFQKSNRVYNIILALRD